jgi:two-component system, OmpR family, phosphate regulon sensor histidine kinase PhoR
MNLPGAFIRELWFVGVFALLLLVIGIIVGHPALLLLLGAAVYLVWHLLHLLRVIRWLSEGRKFHPPDAPGIWNELHYELFRMQQRHRKRKHKLTGLLNRYQETAAVLPDATVVLGPRGECEWWNETATRLFGLHSPQDVGQRIDNLVRFPAFTQYLASGDYSEKVNIPSPINGQILLTIRIVPYGRNQRLLVARDVTQIERLEEIRRDFVANVSHELRTPLTVISGFLEALLDTEEALDENWQRPLQQMQEQAQRMQRIVDDLLLLARLEGHGDKLRSEPVDVPHLLSALRDDAMALSGAKAHRIGVEADAGLWLRGNEDELRSAFSNLIFNAVQYTPAGGDIAIRWFADDAGAHLTVQDSGTGIAAHHLPRLTERFYRADVSRSRERGGTGLGLAIVKHALQRHDAQLAVASELGKGSVFSCDFPPERVLRKA